MFKPVGFSKIALTTILHTALDKALVGRVVVNAAHVSCVLALDLERTLLLSAVGPSAIELHGWTIVVVVARRVVVVVVNTMI